MEREQPHLALLDLMLTNDDGVDLMQAIRETEDVSVIFISANGREDLVARAFDRGAADYVVEPFSPTRAYGPHPGGSELAGGGAAPGTLRAWRTGD